jgi:uncharacterized protein (DUF2147 family)
MNALGWAAALAALLDPLSRPVARPLDGLWQNRIGTLDVLIGPCGAKLCGTIIAARGDSAPRAHPAGAAGLVGTRVLEDFVPGAGGVWRGSVYAPQLHRHLNAKFRIADANRIELTTCLLGSFLCDTNAWHRIPSEVRARTP